jgi:hypothetical protein
MFAASGGSTEVAGFCCFILLSLCIVKKSRGDISRKDYIIFTISVLGAVINTVAPGNYVRHSSADSTGLHILGGGIDTINVVTKITEKIFANTPYVIVFLIAVFVGIYMGKTSKYQEINGILSVTCGLCCVLPFVTGFPVCLGYSSDAYFPNRCEFVETVSIIISSLVIAIVVGYFIGIYVDRVAITEICVVLLVFIIQMQNINSNWKISETVPYQIWQQLGNNEFGEYYDNVKELYEYISKDDNEDVFIYQLPNEIANFSSVSDSVTEDMNYWTNTAISSYFGKSSVQYVKSPVWIPSDDSADKVIRISNDMFDQECNFVSIFIKNDDNQSMDIVQVLEPLVSNKVITIPNDQNGEVVIYVFDDMEGKELLDELTINY